jgi:hypothetical protein
MTTRIRLAVFGCVVFIAVFGPVAVRACCPAPPSGKPVVNADQTVILIWDPATKIEHFIRKATFKSEADDFGFLIPSPTRPELAESGNEAFPFLQKLTEPEVERRSRPSPGISCSCEKQKEAATGLSAPPVRVLSEQEVAGFHAVVLEAKSSDALVDWLKANGYAYSPEIAAWAKPYIDENWKITALKVAKNKDERQQKGVAATALRLSFHSDRPLFPYREPDSKSAAETLEAKSRLLRIYFIADARYDGELAKDAPWTGRVAWTNKMAPDDRKRTLELLTLPETSGPTQWWLTEFEDPWPYRVAPADLYFAQSENQNSVKRPPIVEYVSSWLPDDVTFYAIAAVVLGPATYYRRRRGTRRRQAI